MGSRRLGGTMSRGSTYKGVKVKYRDRDLTNSVEDLHAGD